MMFIVISRLVTLQIIDSEKYAIIAKKQSQTREIISPLRGVIFDRNMNPFVSNIFRVSVIVDPYKLKNPDSVATLLSSVFGKTKQEYFEKLINKNESSFYIERKSELNDLKGLDTVRIDGFEVFKEPSRYYNLGQTAAQIIGYNDLDNKGVSGIELSFNKDMTGKDGYMISRKDGRGNKRPDINYIQKEPESGANIVLTIDKNIQQIAEEELANGISSYNATKGKVVVVSVKTGELLGMCTYPTFDPNNIKKEDTAGMKNAVISDIYEPGSTFKLITASAILEEKLSNANNVINTESGRYKIYGMDIFDSYSASALTFQEAVEKSSNIGFVKLSQILGAERFFKYARDFGFGIYTGIELNGENRGYLKRPIDYTNGSLEFMSIGYQVAINALQLTMAYSAIANNGMLMKPFIVKKIVSPDGRILQESMPSPVRQVVSEATAKELTRMLKGVVERGTGVDAKIEGISIAGKTGTTQKLVDGEYSNSSHISSFIGYFPADNPEIIITIIIDEPKNGYYGGKVAAPVFQKIASRLIDYIGKNNSFKDESLVNNNMQNTNIEATSNTNIIPNLVNMRVKDAQEILKERNIAFVMEKDLRKNELEEQVVSNQEPSYGSIYKNGTVVKLFPSENSIANETSYIIPNVKNMSLRKAINKLVSEGFIIDVNGSGEVVDVFPKSGTKVIPNSKVILFCKEEN
ncbi:MAG: penicillin-binding transpeptidase domain-containing protein [Candidatus Kapaibacterium sp.]